MKVSYDDIIGSIDLLYDNKIKDGVYWSKTKPFVSSYPNLKFDFNEETDYIATPYDTNFFVVWFGEKPKKIDFEGQNNFGSSSAFFVSEPGYITVCAEND